MSKKNFIICVLCMVRWFDSVGCDNKDDIFNEELSINQLSSGSVYSVFQFATRTDINVFEEEIGPHYNLFPKSFGEIISKFGIGELHFSMTQGRWRYNQWGYPLFSAPTGIELWVWFLPNLDIKSVNNNWEGLVHAFSGQFCSSINFVSKAETANPKFTFKPLGLWPLEGKVNRTHLKYATLSRETVCTENLTPWKKLLPCGAKIGLASLLNAVKLYDSSYHSLAVHVQSTCYQDTDCERPVLELRQTISSVFDQYHRAIHGGLNLKNLFGTELKSNCPIAKSSNIRLSGENVNIDGLNPPTFTRDDTGVIYDLLDPELRFPFDVRVSVNIPKERQIKPYILVHKHFTGFGEEYGGITCIIRNTHPDENITLAYLEIIPYFLRVYIHTLRLDINGTQVTPVNLQFSPAFHRERPAQLEFIVVLPPLTTARISLEFEKVFQDWMQHPPDAHHGFYVSSSVISGFLPKITSHLLSNNTPSLRNSEYQSSFHRIYSEPLLIRVPLPDFSMPYNVICLTCTVIAIAFGSIYNLTTRTFQVQAVDEKKSLKERILSLFKKKEKSE